MKTLMQKINGYLEVNYLSGDFIEMIDEKTGHKIKFHKGVIKIINQTIKKNQKP